MTKSQRNIVFTVAFERPPGVSKADARRLIVAALLKYTRESHPVDPVSKFDRKTLVVSYNPMLVP